MPVQQACCLHVFVFLILHVAGDLPLGAWSGHVRTPPLDLQRFLAVSGPTVMRTPSQLFTQSATFDFAITGTSVSP